MVSQEQRIQLNFYQKKDQTSLENYYLTEQQLKYSGNPLDCLQDCVQDNERHPILIRSGEEVAGFFVLHSWGGVKDLSENRNALLLRAFSVNSIFQGQGIATKALAALDLFVNANFPDVNEIILAVNHKNAVAQHVYMKAGFKDTGRRAMGKQGVMYLFSKKVNPET
ncbi:GNAT family N-acetyltransferase [Sporolactobacillus shoreicorticis]|uniref:GNAT family N-acetyltransferase n=1 Tax=Sporolactobacillus shoreicorticis TaxID=1923877 RepID=A0ABW5S505_9BACL|nr:GNAT family N-acetyltransferase [Sporolactobacillus shoreicorticis]MCO7126522.1 GNAT family N-acetyltransferase [Sporolactobacillus shoreicorticis]